MPGIAVLMADGTTKPIEDVELGDLVWAADPETGEEGPREVARLITGDGDKILVDIEIDGDTLDPGDLLLSADGDLVRVDGLDRTSERSGTAYNLTVDDIHTYFVEVGSERLLVHNITGCEEVARAIQAEIGGEIWQVGLPTRYSLASNHPLDPGDWVYNQFVVKDGLVYDRHFGTAVDAFPLQTYMDDIFPDQDVVPWVLLPGGN